LSRLYVFVKLTALVRKVRIFGLIFIGGGFIVALAFFLIGILKPKTAGVFIDTNPASAVFINGLQVGRTPYRDNKQKTGEVVIKLIPESFEIPLVPFETKLNLVNGIETVIRREFGETDEFSSGEIISFEKLSKSEISLVVISNPDSAQLIIDGQTKAFTPYKAGTITPGEHTISISSKDYVDKTIKVKTQQGYKLTAIINLQKSRNIATPTPTPEIEKKTLVEILDTPVGFLRVRAEPSTLGEEVGQVKPNEEYVLVEEDEKTGWYKIELVPAKDGGEAKAGWISNQYAKKIEQGSDDTSPTPSVFKTPTPSVKPTVVN